MSDLNSLDSSAASDLTMPEVNMGDITAAQDDIGEAPKQEAPQEFNEIEDDFFGSEDSKLQTESEVPETEATPEAKESQEASENEGTENDEPEGESTEEQSSDEISIDVFKKEHKFKLDATDAELRRTLRRGVKAPKLKAELDKVNEQLAAFNTPEVQEKIAVWDELKEFAGNGDYDRVFQAILGDSYGTFLDGKINDRLEYEDADPLRRSEIDGERMKRDYEFKDREREKRIQSMEQKAAERQEAADLSKWESYAMPAVSKYGFGEDLVSDPDRRQQLNAKLWKLSWDDIEELADSASDVSPQMVAKVFKKNAQLMKYSSGKVASKEVGAITEKKKKQAAASAASVATSKYPTTVGKQRNLNDVAADWKKSGSKSAKDLLKFWS